MELELILSDLAVVEKRLERLEKDIKKQKNPALEKEFQVLNVCKAALEKQTPLREVELGAEESKVIRGFTFLSLKPMLYVLNLGEGDAARANLADQFAVAGGAEAAVAHGRQCDLWQGGSRTGPIERSGRGGISFQLRIEGIGHLAPDQCQLSTPGLDLFLYRGRGRVPRLDDPRRHRRRWRRRARSTPTSSADSSAPK